MMVPEDLQPSKKQVAWQLFRIPAQPRQIVCPKATIAATIVDKILTLEKIGAFLAEIGKEGEVIPINITLSTRREICCE